MDLFVVTARLALALVFAVAAIGKLTDRAGTRLALSEFRVPTWLVTPGAILLPAAETLAAIGLVFAPTARPAAILAVCLLLAFVGAITRALRAGDAPDCHCFGQIHSAPAGMATLARNLGLAAAAVAVASVGPSKSIDAVVRDHSAPAIALACVSALAVLMAAACFSLWRENRRLRTDADLARRVPGLPLGTPAPTFSLPDQAGRTVTLDELLARERPLVLVFVHADCIPCNELLPVLDGWLLGISEAVTLAAVSAGEFAYKPENIILLRSRGFEVADAYGLRTTPSAIRIAQDGTIFSPPSLGPLGVEELVRASIPTPVRTTA